MKNIIPYLVLSLSILSSCDSPRSQRSLSSSSSSGLTNANTIPVNLNNTNTGTATTPAATTTTTTPATDTATSTIPSDATQCKFSSDGINGYDSTSTHLGDYTLCQSSTDKNITYFQLKTPPSNNNGDVSVCLIPTTSNGTNSIYVGNPMCGYFKDPKAIRKITFIKYAQYSNATITGVMMFKDLSWPYPVYYKFTYGYGYYPVYNNYINTLDAYKLCMNMLADINRPDNCTYYKNVGQYVFKQF